MRKRRTARWVLAALLLAAQATRAGDWLPLARDGVHDPSSPSLQLLQEPREALSGLAPDTAGNQVRWVEALDKGQISPRTNILPETKVNVLDLDVLMNLRGGTPIVRFPHRQHTLWLDCSNCHEHLFKSKAGANKLSMLQILQGEQCGVCHGAVSFPLTECTRCHSVPRGTAASQPAKP
ncbi:MAG TPA: c(7)-type cytochrome triheme domain-containing protein [Burkholderiales bacterium]